MKVEEIYIQTLKDIVTFYIGKNQNEQFDIIDKGKQHDLWFHADGYSSCHVVAILPESSIPNKKNLQEIRKIGSMLCKNNTEKLKGLKNVTFITTYIKNVTKTNVAGSVIATDTKKIIC
jgi:predicted ribosome quality control (RQC) complex YloA/Tae2 family protein